MTGKGLQHPVLAVDVYVPEWEREEGIKPGRTFRVIPSKMWSVENNLSMANADWEDFMDYVEADGIYRGVGE